jgi:hypothetical protein
MKAFRGKKWKLQTKASFDCCVTGLRAKNAVFERFAVFSGTL